MNHVPINTISEELDQLRKTGFVKGDYPGFDVLWQIMSLKTKYPIYLAGAPHAGKTEFLLELLVTASELYSVHNAIYLGESGDPAEIVAELAHKHMKKPYLTKLSKGEDNRYAMTEEERYQAESWVDHHFTIIIDDSNEEFNLWNFYNRCDRIEKEKGVKFWSTSFDPIFHADIPEKYGMKEHMYLKDALKLCNINSREHDRINFLINHITDLPYIMDKDTGIRYYPKAMPSEWAGGKMWHRHAYQMLLLYRPPTHLTDEEGAKIHEENETIVVCQKAKPKGSSKLGEVSIFWDWKKNRYYEKTEDGNVLYARPQGEKSYLF